MRISSRTAQTKILKYWLFGKRIRVIESLKLFHLILLFQSFLKIKKNRNPKAILSVYNVKISSRLTRLFSWSLPASWIFYYLLHFFCIVYVIRFYCCFFLWLIRIFLLRPYRINLKTWDSYQNHDDFPKKPLIEVHKFPE